MKNSRLLSIALLVIILISAVFRFVGTKPGFHPFHSDEGNIYGNAALMYMDENIKLQRYEYPSASHLTNYYFYRNFFVPLSIVKYYIENPDNIPEYYENLSDDKKRASFLQYGVFGLREINGLFWGRYVTAFVGVLVVFLSFLLSTLLFEKKVGLISALLVSVNYKVVINSHFVLPDIYNSFYLLIALLFIYVLWMEKNKKSYFFAALFCGTSFSTKYQFFSFFTFIYVHFLIVLEEQNLTNKIKRLFSPQAVAFPFIVFLVFLAINPYHLLEIEKAVQDVSFASKLYGAGVWRLDLYAYSYLYHYGLGKVTSTLVVFGIAMGVIKRTKRTLFLLTVIVPFFLFTTFYSQGGFYTRNFVTIIPLLLIFAAYGLNIFLPKKGPGERRLDA